MPYPTLFTAMKALARFPGWSEPEPETDYTWFNAPIEIGGVVEASYLLHGGCYRSVPDRNVVFELRAAAPSGKRTIPLARVEWRSLQGGHSNRRRKGSPASGKRVPETHYHSFDLNWIETERRMRSGNLPQADEINQDIQSFDALTACVGNLFRINNMRLVTRPPWAYDLFQNG
jgi:hypothetical protein